MIRYSVFILDDEPDAVSRLEYLLKKYEHLRICGRETSPAKAIPIIRSNRPDILFIDIEMPGFTGFDILERVTDDTYSPIVVFVTAYDKYAIRAIKKSAFDYLLKPVDRDEMDTLIGKLPKFRKPGSHNIDKAINCLTKREREVFESLRRGKSSREISVKLNISVNTVDTHRRRILKKLNFSSTTEILLSYPDVETSGKRV